MKAFSIPFLGGIESIIYFHVIPNLSYEIITEFATEESAAPKS